MDETDDSYSDDSFVLYQVRAKINMSKTQDKAPKKTHLIANLPYRLKQYQTHHKYLRVRLDTCADREGAARAGNDFRPPVSSQPVLVLNANYISRFVTYLTPPKT